MMRRRNANNRRQGGLAATEFFIVSIVLLILGINIWILLRPNDDDFENQVRFDLLQIVNSVNIYRASNGDAYPDDLSFLPDNVPHKDPRGVPYKLTYTSATERIETKFGTEPKYKTYKHAIVKCMSLMKNRSEVRDVSEYAKDYKGKLVLGGFLEGFVTWVRDVDDWEHNLTQSQ